MSSRPGDRYTGKTITLTATNGTQVSFTIPRTRTIVYRKWMWHKRFSEEKGLDWIGEHVGPGCVYIDCGASFGNHTLYFAKVLKARQVHAVEPNEESLNYLLQNIENNDLAKVVDIHPWAAANHFGFGELRYRWRAQDFGTVHEIEEKRCGSIPIGRLESEFEYLKQLDVLKIDCERHTTPALYGAQELLAKHRPLLYLEVKRSEWPAVNEILVRHKYQRVFKVGRATFIFAPR